MKETKSFFTILKCSATRKSFFSLVMSTFEFRLFLLKAFVEKLKEYNLPFIWERFFCLYSRIHHNISIILGYISYTYEFLHDLYNSLSTDKTTKCIYGNSIVICSEIEPSTISGNISYHTNYIWLALYFCNFFIDFFHTSALAQCNFFLATIRYLNCTQSTIAAPIGDIRTVWCHRKHWTHLFNFDSCAILFRLVLVIKYSLWDYFRLCTDALMSLTSLFFLIFFSCIPSSITLSLLHYGSHACISILKYSIRLFRITSSQFHVVIKIIFECSNLFGIVHFLFPVQQRLWTVLREG